ncbi:cytochrome P450, putative [Talaromyces stipitatus ATCC 10500]|uniref:Cytochrome P450, putative n=1 Tax=Talaromyces stipitatus (strain ATCC 10500 / CBS 375.48 / QM 6759 / NRRL 1006) TaxID=441959 RepID=B8MC55_TALSN|nr:cytochrome P450, putative [Talaromyces stipitatus ATCC 10500]EED18501.1 cytochrome P450, putative [Talaromyces stipitatus ATCC 10500]
MLTLFWSAVVSWLAYLVFGAIYRLCFHPLSRFPGPRLAGLTKWYEFYYDVVNPGQFIWQIERMHEKYGPIVRITPDELHIKDPDFYEVIYAPASKKRDKYVNWTIGAGAPASSFATVSHEQHRLRRSALNPYFSKTAISNNASALVRDKIERLCQRFSEASHSRQALRLDAAYMALTMDIITHYAFGESYNYLAEPDFKLEWKETVIGGSSSGAMIRQFPWALSIMKSIPLVVMSKLAPDASLLVRWQIMVRRQVDSIIANNRSGTKASGTIFQALLDSDLPPEEKSADRLQDEAQTLVGAGSETTAKVLTIITFYLLQDKKMLEKLRQELSTVETDFSASGRELLTALEKLPYMNAVINEGLRLMHGVTTRLPRVAHEPIQYKQWTIPASTPVSQCNLFVHMDPTLFPEPTKFNPERWMDAKQNNTRLDRYLVSFGKGSRQCVGINLAYAEIFLTLALVLSRFDMETYETTTEDIRIARDYFVGVPEPGSQGVRVIVTKEL